MINFKRIENNLDNSDIKTMDNFKNLSISTSVIECENPFDICVKVGDDIKINQPILVSQDNQKILSDISGKVLDIKLKEETNKTLTYCVELENNFKNEKLSLNIKPINTKNDLIIAIKEYGIVNKNFLIYKELEKTEKVLLVDCFDEPFIYNNFAVLNNYLSDVKNALQRVKLILQIEKIIFYSSKNNLNFINQIKSENDKIHIKKCKKNAITMFDLLKISYLLKGEILEYDILSLTGKALKENVVLYVKKGAKIQDIIDNFGGFKQDIEEVENFKYTAMLAYNDEVILKDKIKKSKNEIDKQKLIKMLKDKQLEAKTKIYDNLKMYYQKYLDCLSACFISIKNKKFATKNLNLALKNNYLGLHFLNNKQFH